MAEKEAIYDSIIRKIFLDRYRKGVAEFDFGREEIAKAATALKLSMPKNLGDVVYTYRYRKELPPEVLSTQPRGLHWLILGAGDARYRFRLNKLNKIRPTPGLLVRKIPDATPEIVVRYSFNDEQALLARIRYNRLVDIFLGITAYSLQNHLRTKVANYGQIEIDELYVGVDSRGAQYAVPVQAKGGNDELGVIQTIQDTEFCRTSPRYSHSTIRPVSAQFLADGVIALFEMIFDGDEVSIVQERHYRLADSSSISKDDLAKYATSGN